jgi:hypothetical protein
MDWNYDLARGRIEQLIRDVPVVAVEPLDQRIKFLRESRVTASLSSRDALVSIPRNRAVLVDGVHLYWPSTRALHHGDAYK